VKLQTRNVSSTAPGDRQVLGWNLTTLEWEPISTATGTLTNVSTGNGLLGGPISSTGTISVDAGTAGNQILQLSTAAQIPAVDGNLVTNVNAVKLQAKNVSNTSPAADQVLRWNNSISAWEPSNTTSGTVTNVATGSGLLGGPINSTGTLSVDVGTGAVTASPSTGAASIFHLAADGTSVWGSGIPDDPIAKVDLTGGAGFVGAPSLLTITSGGDGVESLTGLAFVGSTAYYTSSGAAGTGSFGTVNLATGDTTQLFAGVDAAHGILFDPFTGDLILVGDSEIRQYDPVGGVFVAEIDVAGNQFDQAAADGKGHLFVASNDSDLFFIDYSGTSDLDAGGNFSTLVSGFKASLDDVAPLSGPGSQEQPIPEPASMLLFGLGGLGAIGLRNRRQQTTV
jgi:hypothetical protein